MKAIAAIILVALNAGFAAAQPPPVIGSTRQEVLLDVIVRDKKGKAVRDLSAADFQITDGGAAQNINSIRLVESEAAGSANLDPMRQVRLVTLVFERLGQDARTLARQAALDLIKTDTAPNVYFGVFSVDQGLSVLQQYTADRERLKKAIEKATAGAASQFHDDSAAIESTLHTLDSTSDPVQLQFAQTTLNMLEFSQTMERTQQGRSSIFSLLSVVQEQFKLPGRKTVLYFSEGLQIPSNLTEQFHSMIGVANRANVSVYAIDARGLLTSVDTTRSSQMLAESARQSRVSTTAFGTATTFDQAKGLDRAEDSMRANAQNSLAELAESTGGFLVANTNDLRNQLHRIAEDINVYYEIAYSPNIEVYDGSFRKIGVKMARTDLRVQARSGYFALPFIEGHALLPFEMPMLTALSSNPLPRAIPYRAAGLHFGPGESSFVIDVPLDSATFIKDPAANAYRTHLAVLALLKDGQGRVVKKFSQDVPYQGPIDKLEAAKLGHFIYKQHAALPPGRYTFETAVLDREANKVSARKSVFTVLPPSHAIGLSSVLLIRRIEAEATESDPKDPFVFQGGKVTPTLSDSVAPGPGATLSLYFVVYPLQGATEAPELKLEFVRDGQIVAAGSPALPTPDAQGRIPYVATSPTQQFKPGDYEVRVTVKQGASAAQEHAFFTIQ
jgi:VWFA-related protein